jgi:DUF971 family protein
MFRGKSKSCQDGVHVGIMGVEPVGHYAIRIRFDDLHDSGIYSWAYLYELGRRQDELWAAYLKALSDRGLSPRAVSVFHTRAQRRLATNSH